MNKNQISLIEFVAFILTLGIFVLTDELMALGLALLFGIMFFTDSLWFFLKKYFFKDKLKAIGVN